MASEELERRFALAKEIAAENRLEMPYYNSERAAWTEASYARPFLIATMRDDPTDSDDGYGCRQIGSTDWAESPEHAAHLIRGRMEWKGWRRIVVWDVERKERCNIEIGVAITYNAVTRCIAVARPEYMTETQSGNAPALNKEK